MKTKIRMTLALGLAGIVLNGGLVACCAQAAAPKEEPKDKWETAAAVGATVTRGNSDTLLLTANILSARKWDRNEMRLGADGTYGETEDVKNTESLHGFAQYNRLFTERIYGYLRFDALHDAIADVDYRLTLSPGVGYYFIKTAQTTLSGEVGPGFVYEKQGNDETGYVTLRIAERFEHKLNERVRIWQSIEFLPQVDNFDNFLINAEIGVDTGLTEKLFLSVFAVDTYDNEPAPGRDQNDLKLVAALKYKF
jgi:putative salt-induced outer membrane protein YdiY